MKFTKYTGIGNDFIVLDGQTAADVKNPNALGKTLCDRRFGVGADGLALLLASEKADARMRIINSDGSEAEMCGNASRCVALHLYSRGLVNKKQISLETPAGIIRTEITGEPNGLVRVDMGVPRFMRAQIPMRGDPSDTAVDVPLECGDEVFYGTAVSMGNPHFVLFVPNAERADVTGVGPRVEKHPDFPNKTNVEFVQVLGPDRLRMRVWERGAGVTKACGTGSCAALAAAVLNNKTGRRVTAVLDGGELLIEWPDQKNIYMTGPAQEVFRGEYTGTL